MYGLLEKPGSMLQSRYRITLTLFSSKNASPEAKSLKSQQSLCLEICSPKSSRLSLETHSNGYIPFGGWVAAVMSLGTVLTVHSQTVQTQTAC